jgi:aspartyl-tRNA(Asn)/glutamyl-tRNA(Gln) amidotransferase subunit C
MIKKMTMDEQRLKEVLTLSRIGLPESEFGEVLNRVNAVFRMCDNMAELDLESVQPFEWDVKAPQGRRADCPDQWGGREKFLSQAPTVEGDFFRVPRIIAVDEGAGEAEE